MTSENIERIDENVYALMKSAQGYLSKDTTFKMNDFIRLGRKLMYKNPTLEAGIVNEMMLDSVMKLFFQEVESNRQQFTDHGIRHIVKNITTQSRMLDSLAQAGVEIGDRDRLMAYFIMVNHDMGYTAGAVRQGGIEGIKASSKHLKYSVDIMREQKEIWDVGHLFTEEEFERVCEIIGSHDSTSLDMTDPVAFTTRLSDNLAMFHAEKLPSMFKYVEGSVPLLQAMGLDAKNEDKESFAKHRDELFGLVDKSNIDENLKRDLKMGVNEISMMTPKFTMGTLAGELADIRSGKDCVMAVTIDFNEFDEFLQQYFDMGQNQLKKLLKAYGITEFDKSEYVLGQMGGRPIVKIRVRNTRSASLAKERVYLKPWEDAPVGKVVQRGEKGGRFYESGSPVNKKPEELTSDQVTDQPDQDGSELEWINDEWYDSVDERMKVLIDSDADFKEFYGPELEGGIKGFIDNRRSIMTENWEWRVLINVLRGSDAPDNDFDDTSEKSDYEHYKKKYLRVLGAMKKFYQALTGMGEKDSERLMLAGL